jgi:hypothetical protein
MYGVPASAQVTGDLHRLNVETSTRFAVNLFHTMSNQTVTLGSLLTTAPVVTTLEGPYRRLQASATIPSDYSFMSYSYGDQNSNVTLAGSAAYFGGQSMTVAMPDLSGLAGVSATWFPPAGSQSAFTYTVGSALMPPCTDGGIFRGALKFGSNQEARKARQAPPERFSKGIR